MNRRLRILCEGSGDSAALPILVRRTLELKQAKDALWLDKHPPMRVGNVVRLLNNDAAEWERLVRAAAYQGPFGLLTVLDGDVIPPGFGAGPFCAKRVATRMADVASKRVGAGRDFSLAIVFACKEYETWLVAGIESLAGKQIDGGRRRIREGLTFPPGEVESHGKAWLQKHVPGYSETLDQPALSESIDLREIQQRQLRSFRRFEHALDQLASAAREQSHICTPRASV